MSGGKFVEWPVSPGIVICSNLGQPICPVCNYYQILIRGIPQYTDGLLATTIGSSLPQCQAHRDAVHYCVILTSTVLCSSHRVSLRATTA